jgi:hypothetical protein
MLINNFPRRKNVLTRRGALVEEQGSTYMCDNDCDSDGPRTGDVAAGAHAAAGCAGVIVSFVAAT